MGGVSAASTASAAPGSAPSPPWPMADWSAAACLPRSDSVTAPSAHLGSPAFSARSIWSWHSFLISAWARSRAWISSSSEICSAPASTMVMASGVPQTIRSSVDSLRSGSVGLTARLPSIRPMRTAPTGPRNGIGDSMSAAEEPLIARMSCGCTWSAENVVTMI